MSSGAPVFESSKTTKPFAIWGIINSCRSERSYLERVYHQRYKITAERSTVDASERLVSLIIPTHRPENLSQILTKVSKWSVANPQITITDLVVGCHGFMPSSTIIEDSKAFGFSVQFKYFPEDVFVGHMLSSLTKEALADCVIKFDDDDLYEINYPTQMALEFMIMGLRLWMPAQFFQVGFKFKERKNFDGFVWVEGRQHMEDSVNVVSGSTLCVFKPSLGSVAYGNFQGASDTGFWNNLNSFAPNLQIGSGSIFATIVCRSETGGNHAWSGNQRLSEVSLSDGYR